MPDRRYSHRPISPLPPWVGIIFFAVCVGLVPQIVTLSSTLREVAIAAHWRIVWVGLDIAEALAFLLTAWFLLWKSALVIITASVAGTLLLLDAWFDVLTSFRRANLVAATNLAVFVEVPLAILCFAVALRTIGLLRRRSQEHASQANDLGAAGAGAKPDLGTDAHRNQSPDAD